MASMRGADVGEPTLSEVHADLVGRLEHDKRLRAVEQRQARIEAVIEDLPRMEERIMRALGDVKHNLERLDSETTSPRPIWPALSAVVAAVALILVIAERLYS